MSKFNSYARELDEIAKNAFKKYREAEAVMKEAEAKDKDYPRSHNMNDPKHVAEHIRLHQLYVDASNAYIQTKRWFEDMRYELAGLRNKLEAAINDANRVDPAALDNNTLELLKSGALKGGDYKKLLNDAKAANNPTMVRLIGKYASDAAKATRDKNGQNDPEAMEMRMVAYESQRSTGGDRLEAFDTMADLFKRCTKNPRMIDHWEGFTADIVENF